jgi:tRNA wybutosine-synthesizing protein 3
MADPWERRKSAFLERIERDREIGYLDPGIEETLDLINSREKSYTTSSCSGRISAVDSEFPWKRDDEHPIFKKHAPITEEELEDLLKVEPKDIIWLIVSGPILHICCRDIEEAGEMLRVARQAGFKHSGIMSISEDCFMVELISGTQLFLPLKSRTKLFIEAGSMNDILFLVNESLSEGRNRLKRLNEALRA